MKTILKIIRIYSFGVAVNLVGFMFVGVERNIWPHKIIFNLQVWKAVSLSWILIIPRYFEVWEQTKQEGLE